MFKVSTPTKAFYSKINDTESDQANWSEWIRQKNLQKKEKLGRKSCNTLSSIESSQGIESPSAVNQAPQYFNQLNAISKKQKNDQKQTPPKRNMDIHESTAKVTDHLNNK